jgi:hypothetical protein
MDIQSSKQLKLTLSSLVVAAVFLIVLAQGWSAGKNLAEASAVITASREVAKGLKFFYQDQNRYPSPVEFENSEVMLNYFNVYPLPNFVSKICPQTFSYRRNNADSFQLNFCLPVANADYVKGWNSLTSAQ